jgi:glycine/D-amino acid oxidase-like deaminating enzyme
MRVAVLGAGLQGVCVAMELALHDVQVDLYDRADQSMCGASSHNEGKIHLGYVYANDLTRLTARTMIQGALTFAPLLRRWLGSGTGGGLDAVSVSEPFHYVVHRDSLLGVPEVEEHFAACQEIAIRELDGAEPDYFGMDPRRAPQPLARQELIGRFDPRAVQAAYSTSEIAIDPRGLAAAVRHRLAAATGIQRRMRAEVHAVAPDDDAVTVHWAEDGTSRSERYDQVVNALWEGRLGVDATAGVQPDRPWLYRVKHYLRLPPGSVSSLGSTTIMLGAFGDVVTYADGGAFLSWYPVGRRGSSRDLTPPAWPLVLDQRAQHVTRHATHAGLSEVVAAVRQLPQEAIAGSTVEGGIIVAHGHTDIDDPESVLHERHAIGPRSFGRYHTVDTGKLTMAPLFGLQTAERVLAPDVVEQERLRA